MFRSDIREVLQQARFKAGLSRRELGERAGVSPATIYNLEKGRGMPLGQTIYAVAKVLEVDLEPYRVVEGAAAS